MLQEKQINITKKDGYVGRCFEILDGVFLGYYHCNGDVEWIYDKITKPNTPDFLINYCFSGIYSADFANGATQSHGNQKLTLSTSITGKGHKKSKITGPVYEALSLVFLYTKFPTWLKKIFVEWEVDFNELISRFSMLNRWYSIDCPENIKTILDEIKIAIQENNLPIIQLKILESIYLISRMLMEENKKSYSFFSKTNVYKVREICNEMTAKENIDIPIKEIVKTANFNYNVFSKIFKHIYGCTPKAYRNELKINKAAWDLKNTTKSILEISIEAGYLNPGKFSSAFKKIMSITPSNYRLMEKEL